MDINLPYVQQPSGKKHYRYRRKVPAFLREALGKTEIILPLGKTPAEVMRHYGKAHEKAEAELKAAAKGKPKVEPKTDLERYQWATRHVAEWNLTDPDEISAAIEGIMDRYRVYGGAEVTEDGRRIPIGHQAPLSDQDAAIVQALMAPHRKPEPTLTDAVRLYLKEKVEGTPDETKKRQRVERVQGHVVKALSHQPYGKDPQIRALTRSDAREVRDHMLVDVRVKPSTAHRYLNDLRAIITHAIKELDLRGAVNPFNGLEVKKDTLAKDDRKPFTEGQLKATRGRIMAHASTDLQRIWRMLEGTGCRLAEVSGLLVEDMHLDGETPYLDLVVHPHRRLKNAGSVRRVPLVGDALRAAQEAVLSRQTACGEAVDASTSAIEARPRADSPAVFPIYGREGGATVASAALMKHVRKVVADPKVTVHSLRHRIKDRLIVADVPENVQNMILGQSSGAVSEAYGGPEARLRVAYVALSKALNKALG